MVMVWRLVLCVVFGACSGRFATPRVATTGVPVADLPKLASTSLVNAVRERDIDAIAGMFPAPVSYGGLWFADPACAKKFPEPKQIEAPELAAFANCVATLDLRPGTRGDRLFDIVTFEYGPGLEIAVRFAFVGNVITAHWIGHSDRDPKNRQPSITATALDALRTEGTPTTNGEAAWLHVCLDETGTIASVKAIEGMSVAGGEAIAAAVRTWKFKPFEIDHHATAACAIVRIGNASPEVLETSLPIAAGQILVTSTSMQRSEGETMVVPDDADKIVFSRVGGGTITGAYLACVDTTGKVIAARPVETSGLPGYDKKILARMRTWIYKPVLRDGAPVSACTMVIYTYSQQ